MSAEKFVKKAAADNLKGNWPMAIFAVLTMMFVPIVALLLLVMAYSMLGDSESVSQALTESSVKTVLFVGLHILSVASVVLLSPVFAGFVRIFTAMANGKTVDPADLIYFFENKTLYANAVKFVTSVIVKTVGVFMLCDVAGVAVIALAGDDNDALFSVGALLSVIGALAAFGIVHRYAFSMALFSSGHYSPSEAAQIGSKLAKGNTIKLVKLTVSFFWHILLTFFVVPFVYVYPYMTCSYFTSIRYIKENFDKQESAVQHSVTNDYNVAAQSVGDLGISFGAVSEGGTVGTDL